MCTFSVFYFLHLRFWVGALNNCIPNSVDSDLRARIGLGHTIYIQQPKAIVRYQKQVEETQWNLRCGGDSQITLSGQSTFGLVTAEGRELLLQSIEGP